MSGEGSLKAKIGPLILEPSDWKELERTVRILSKSEHGRQVFFAVVGTENGGMVNADGLAILPLRSLAIHVDRETTIVNPEIMPLLSEIKDLVAFGYVRTENSIEPTEHDFTLSVMLDRKFGRPIHYIVMNDRFEYEVYRSDPRNLYGLMKAVDEDNID